ncbi:MAG: ribose 5-phosphate isomerase B [Firmicutes bacterium]|jgi:ribose 5-phosphate isomerase B|nr:ribose 5-phosphate isomerase B [Bacillota bacterium]
MKIALASDHGGFQLKEQIAAYLQEQGIDYRDFGTDSEESVDYPDFALAAAEAVARGECTLGILCCGTGIGVAIVANKVPGIRAANCHDTFSARMSREHNNANILTLGQRVVGCGLALDVVEAFLQAKYTGGRHACRVDKITAIEKKYCGQGMPGQ